MEAIVRPFGSVTLDCYRKEFVFISSTQLLILYRVLGPTTFNQASANPTKLVKSETHVVKRHSRNLNLLPGIISHALWKHGVKINW